MLKHVQHDGGRYTCLILYLIPRTALRDAMLMMALLGGAMATQIRAESQLFSHILFSLYLGLFMWGGLWLRDQRLRALFPIARDLSAAPASGNRAALQANGR